MRQALTLSKTFKNMHTTSSTNTHTHTRARASAACSYIHSLSIHSQNDHIELVHSLEWLMVLMADGRNDFMNLEVLHLMDSRRPEWRRELQADS